jgi:hypothetical protein
MLQDEINHSVHRILSSGRQFIASVISKIFLATSSTNIKLLVLLLHGLNWVKIASSMPVS